MIHDYIITGYNINFVKGILVIDIINDRDDKIKKQIMFKDVLSYQFKNEIPYSIILDLEEWPIEDFFSGNQKLLEDKERWAIRYKSPLELKEEIKSRNLKYYNLYSSYGMSGWILSESYEVLTVGD